MAINNKLPSLGTTIFTVMSKTAADYKAINLFQGYADFSVPADLIEWLNHYATEGFNQYPPTHGISYLRRQIKEKISR